MVWRSARVPASFRSLARRRSPSSVARYRPRPSLFSRDRDRSAAESCPCPETECVPSIRPGDRARQEPGEDRGKAEGAEAAKKGSDGERKRGKEKPGGFSFPSVLIGGTRRAEAADSGPPRPNCASPRTWREGEERPGSDNNDARIPLRGSGRCVRLLNTVRGERVSRPPPPGIATSLSSSHVA